MNCDSIVVRMIRRIFTWNKGYVKAIKICVIEKEFMHSHGSWIYKSIMSGYSKVNSVSHDRVDDVDSFYECGISLAQNVDGDNEEYVVSKIDGASVDDTDNGQG